MFIMKNTTLVIIIIIAAAASLSLIIYLKKTHEINTSLLQIEQLRHESPDSVFITIEQPKLIRNIRV